MKDTLFRIIYERLSSANFIDLSVNFSGRQLLALLGAFCLGFDDGLNHIQFYSHLILSMLNRQKLNCEKGMEESFAIPSIGESIFIMTGL